MVAATENETRGLQKGFSRVTGASGAGCQNDHKIIDG